jgi:hypothetical protein
MRLSGAIRVLGLISLWPKRVERSLWRVAFAKTFVSTYRR